MDASASPIKHMSSVIGKTYSKKKTFLDLDVVKKVLSSSVSDFRKSRSPGHLNVGILQQCYSKKIL